MWLRKSLGGATIRHIVISSAIYGALQFLSLFFIQSQYLYEIQLALTLGEIVRSYWFAIDTVIYYIVAVAVTSLLLAKHATKV
jgi:hypothetical protein